MFYFLRGRAEAELHFDVDGSQFREMVECLTGKELRKAINSAIRQSANILRRGVVKEVKMQWPNSGQTRRKTRVGFTEGRPIWRDVKVAIWKGGYLGATLSLYSTRSPKSRAYVLRFLNSPTNKRYTKKRYYRGAVGGGANPPNFGFFARGWTPKQQAALDGLEKNLRKAIQKAVDKKKASYLPQ